MQEFNARCDPPWSEKELEHKLDSAEKVTRHSQPRGYLLGERGSALSSQVEPSVTILRVDTSEPLPGEKQQLSPKENSERSVPSVPELSDEDLVEANRIAGELRKLRAAGAISSDPRDPEAAFFAHFLFQFSATFQPARQKRT